jgi:hypothetical protein
MPLAVFVMKLDRLKKAALVDESDVPGAIEEIQKHETTTNRISNVIRGVKISRSGTNDPLEIVSLKQFV